LEGLFPTRRRLYAANLKKQRGKKGLVYPEETREVNDYRKDRLNDRRKIIAP
jgi:hypothetical protein